MSYEEALEWLQGKRSMVNILSSASEDPNAWAVATAQADAAMTQQAYWVARAHEEGLVEATP